MNLVLLLMVEVLLVQVQITYPPRKFVLGQIIIMEYLVHHIITAQTPPWLHHSVIIIKLVLLVVLHLVLIMFMVKVVVVPAEPNFTPTKFIFIFIMVIFIFSKK